MPFLSPNQQRQITDLRWCSAGGAGGLGLLGGCSAGCIYSLCVCVCVVSDGVVWGQWSACSVACGLGVESRRPVFCYAHNRRLCLKVGVMQHRPCIRHACNAGISPLRLYIALIINLKCTKPREGLDTCYKPVCCCH